MCVKLCKLFFNIDTDRNIETQLSSNHRSLNCSVYLTDFLFFQLTKKTQNPNSFVEFSVDKDVQKSKVLLSFYYTVFSICWLLKKRAGMFLTGWYALLSVVQNCVCAVATQNYLLSYFHRLCMHLKTQCGRRALHSLCTMSKHSNSWFRFVK